MEKKLHITQGEYAVGEGEGTVITTLLGSCVACCLWDEKIKVGGMNHMLLASNTRGSTEDKLAQINEIELLINALVKLGARRHRLKAKAFGGANMFSGLPSIGQDNAEFTLQFLQSENIPVVTQSLGGNSARNIRFWPATGKVQQRLTQQSTDEIIEKPAKPSGNGLELF